MDIFQQTLLENAQLAQLSSDMSKESGIYDLTGVSDAAKPLLVHGLFNDHPKLVITPDEERSRSLFEACHSLDDGIVRYPAKDLLFYQSDIHGNKQTAERIHVLKAIRQRDNICVITSIDALLNRLVPANCIYDNIQTIKIGDELNVDRFLKKLVNMGYESVSVCERRGECCLRGGIIDIFPLVSEHPYRIELWDDEVDSIRIFDESTQKSLSKTDSAEIYPAMELVLESSDIFAGVKRMEEDMLPIYEEFRSSMKTEEAFRLKSSFEEKKESLTEGLLLQEAEALLPYFFDKTETLLDYLPDDILPIYDDAAAICERAVSYSQEFAESCQRRMASGALLPRQADMLFDGDELVARLSSMPGIMFSMLETSKAPFPITSRYYLHTTSPNTYRGNMPLLLKDLSAFRRNKIRTVMVLSSRTQCRRLTDDLISEGLNAFFTEDASHTVQSGEIMLLLGRLETGIIYPESGVTILGEQDLFGRSSRRKKRSKKNSGDSDTARIRALSDLAVGDYVVHENHGLGIYQGIEKIEMDRVEKDYIKISYAKGANLYILASQFDMISKYGNATDKKPKLSTLGSIEWSKTKSRVRGAVATVARDLVDLYALRSQNTGFKYGPDTVWQKEFEETFPYEETQGQLNAIADVKSDMMSSKIMDRLICGDVGYGKTEVALRAAFKAVLDGKQVVFLCPTTILCRQHYNTFVQRMAGYPVNVGMLSRFRTTAENKATVNQLAAGEIDIVIGTHRALSKDVHFKDLGLLIIDEEQRFGVTHKEKIKQLKKNVDVMCLSATPIPRTLHMSLVGIRDMSLLDEAPMERMPIQTFVFEQNDEMIREAIHRELARGGQVYYVVNRIRGIEDLTSHIASLAPGARVEYAHGRMPKNKLEEIMGDFINKDIDILVATTIIEIGLDISNVNTIMIHDADKLGLSQLYQLRGRVGRSSRSAYAYLMYRRDSILREVAEKRLAAIREFSELGSGFKIAMRDLEIRGAGTMLGEAQSGHMEAVGYDLYCKLLSEAVRQEKGESVDEDFETTVDLTLDAYIPESYIKNETEKLSMYRRIANIDSEDAKDELIEEWIDRYGDPPKAILNLLLVAEIRHLAKKLFITELKQNNMKISMRLRPDARLNPVGIPPLVNKYSPCLTFIPDSKKPAFELDLSRYKNITKKDVPKFVQSFLGELRDATAFSN